MTHRSSRRPRQTTTPSSWCVIAIAVLVLATSAPRADAPVAYAIRGARLVTVAGAPIASGTLVVRDGVIEAVGASVAPPPDAIVIDGKGLTVYPGLIDLGNVKAAEQPGPAQPPNLRTTADLERWKREQILRPNAHATDTLKIDDGRLAPLASAGVTSVLALPPGEVITGESAFVNIVAPPAEPQIGDIVEPRLPLAIVRTPVALHVSFPDHPRTGGNAYPESLMGVIAFVRQAFLDAQHYDAEKTHAQKERAVLADDAALDALAAALNRRIPVAFEANEAREIRRALNMASEFNLDPLVTGARDAGEAMADLKAHGARVIYSLNFPQRPRTLAPDADEPLRVVRERVGAPSVPGELAKANVPFAFESAGLDDPKQFLKNAAATVKAGLPPDRAIRALTIDAATIVGAADRLGTLEKGKIANLVVTNGDLFDEKTAVQHVFVGGRPVNVVAAPRPRAATAAGNGGLR